MPLTRIDSTMVSAGAGAKNSQQFSASVGQTTFTINGAFVPGTNDLEVYVGGLKQAVSDAYNETGASTFVLAEPIQDAGTLVEARWTQGVQTMPWLGGAHNASHAPGGSDALSTWYAALTSGKLAQPLAVNDTRGTSTTPDSYNKEVQWNFKSLSAVGLDAAGATGTYCALLGIGGWSDDSGGSKYEVAFANDGIWVRSGTEAGGWGAWGKLYDAAAGSAVPTIQQVRAEAMAMALIL